MKGSSWASPLRYLQSGECLKSLLRWQGQNFRTSVGEVSSCYKSCRKQLQKDTWDGLEFISRNEHGASHSVSNNGTRRTGFLRSWSQQCHQQLRPQAENICQKTCQRCTCKHPLEREQETVYSKPLAGQLALSTSAGYYSIYLWMCRRLRYISRKYEVSSSSYFHSQLWIRIIGCLGPCWGLRAMYAIDYHAAGKTIHGLKPSYISPEEIATKRQ